MNMDELYKVVEISEKEIKGITDNGKYRSREEIDSVYKLMDVIKDFYCLEDMQTGGYSEDGSYEMSGRRYNSSNRGSYRGTYEGSYGRGRGAKRYADGRYAPYSNEYVREGSYRYSREGKEEFVDQLHELMENAPDEKTRQSIQRMIQQTQE